MGAKSPRVSNGEHSVQCIVLGRPCRRCVSRLRWPANAPDGEGEGGGGGGGEGEGEGEGERETGGREGEQTLINFEENVLVLCLSSASSSAAWVWNDEDLQDARLTMSIGSRKIVPSRGFLGSGKLAPLHHSQKAYQYNSKQTLCRSDA